MLFLMKRGKNMPFPTQNLIILQLKKKKKKDIPHLHAQWSMLRLIIHLAYKMLLNTDLHLLLSLMYHFMISMDVLAERWSSIVDSPTQKGYCSRCCRNLLCTFDYLSSPLTAALSLRSLLKLIKQQLWTNQSETKKKKKSGEMSCLSPSKWCTFIYLFCCLSY